MKKLLFTLCMASLIFACTKSDPLTESPVIDALSEAYDNSNFGNYKGVFTTLDSETRATVDVRITPDGAKATLTTEAGKVHEFYTKAEIVQGELTDVRFEGPEGSFNFEVDPDGGNVAITDVMYLDKPADILAKKNTAKALVNPVTGTYNCTNCNTGQAADAHPHFTTNSVTETFSFVFSGTPGSRDIETQIMYDGTPYNDSNAGTEGTENSNLGNITTADSDATDGNVTISGMSTVIANVDWEGTHTFSGDVSSISGFWDFETGGYIMIGTFQGVENAVFSESFDFYDGTGVVASPNSGQLDSDIWEITGMSDGSSPSSSGDFARGTTSGGVSTGGLYSYTAGGNGGAIWLQPIGSDFTPGNITLTFTNNTGSSLSNITISYKVLVLNDQDRSNSFNFSHSSDNATFTSEASLDFTSTALKDGTPTVQTFARTIVLTGVNIANGANYYLRWTGSDVGGSGSRDEFGLDDVLITSN